MRSERTIRRRQEQRAQLERVNRERERVIAELARVQTSIADERARLRAARKSGSALLAHLTTTRHALMAEARALKDRRRDILAGRLARKSQLFVQLVREQYGRDVEQALWDEAEARLVAEESQLVCV